MSTGLLIVLVAGGSALIVAVALVMSRGGGAGGRLCGGCQRAMLPAWTECLFCGWSPAASSARLEVVSGPLIGQHVPLDGEITTIGSIPGNTVVLSDTAVSKRHAGIRLAGGRFELADLGSTNGVFVNGGRTAKKELDDGDVIRIGLSEIVFRR